MIVDNDNFQILNYVNMGTVDEKIFNKNMSRIKSLAYQNIKNTKCICCDTDISSCCNSHSIPRFCLNNISQNGKLYTTLNIMRKNVQMDTGINKAGTFHIMCKKCDNTIFNDYENPSKYMERPTNDMLNQIAIKNFIYKIYVQRFSSAIYDILIKENKCNEPFNMRYAVNQKQKIDNDVLFYTKCFNRIMNANVKYNILFYRKLNYIVPIAFQNVITLVEDLKYNIIHNLWESNVQTQDLHIAIFPLDGYSIVLIFVESGHKKYNELFKQIKQKSIAEQLSIINYIVFLYSEDVIISKSISKDILNNDSWIKILKKTTTFIGASNTNIIKQAQKAFDLNKHNTIPNLLDKKYSVYFS